MRAAEACRFDTTPEGEMDRRDCHEETLSCASDRRQRAWAMPRARRANRRSVDALRRAVRSAAGSRGGERSTGESHGYWSPLAVALG
jgi:hypothetical protein